jgi:OmpA-OmpF porin, OOP family
VIDNANKGPTRRVQFGAVAACAMLFGTAAGAQDSCDALTAVFNTSLTQTDLSRTLSAARQVLERDTPCPVANRREVRRRTAIAHLMEATRTPGIGDAAALKLLEAGAQFDQPWQLMAAIGDLRDKVPSASGRPDRAGASLAYQAALADISNSVTVPQPPSEEIVKRIVRLAQQTRAAAPEFIPGDILLAPEFRGIAIEEVTVPVEFVRDSDELTERGRKAAEDVARVLAEQDRPRILLTGHTDLDGGDQYNLDLSKRRAQALQKFLIGHGYAADDIETDGRGKREPLKIENEGNYSKEEIYQMLRRVEVKFR